MKKWIDVIGSFTNADPLSEIPVLFFKRDAVVHQGIEKKIHNPLVVKLLFHEMTFNVIHAIYPCSISEAAYLAAIQLHIACGSTATKDDVKEIDGCQIPDHLTDRISTKKWAKLVLEERERITVPAEDTGALFLLYLEFGRKWRYYGATFFPGEIEQPESKSVWRDRPNEVVRVGVNLDGFQVINDKKNEVKLALPFDKVAFDSFEDDETGDSSLVLEFDAGDAPQLIPKVKKGEKPFGPGDKLQMIIWTQQALMIDALASRFIEELDKWQEFMIERNKSRGETLGAIITPLGRLCKCVLFCISAHFKTYRTSRRFVVSSRASQRGLGPADDARCTEKHVFTRPFQVQYCQAQQEAWFAARGGICCCHPSHGWWNLGSCNRGAFVVVH